MGGDEGDGISRIHNGGEGLHQGLPLDGIGRTCRLVYQNEKTLLLTAVEHFADSCYLGGKATQAVHLVLLVADTEHHIVDRLETTAACRQWESKLIHHLSQPHTFQQHRLASHVGSSDERYTLGKIYIHRLVT